MRRGQTEGGIGRQMIQRIRGHSKDFSLYSKNNAKPLKIMSKKESGSCFFKTNWLQCRDRPGGWERPTLVCWNIQAREECSPGEKKGGGNAGK